MIAYLAAWISLGIAVMNGLGAYHLYCHYRLLAEESPEFAGRVISLIRDDNGEIAVDPVVLAGEAMDHMSRMSGIVKWIKG